MEPADLIHRFTYHPPNDNAKACHQEVRDRVCDTAERLNVLLLEGREKSLAITKLEEAMFWANASIARQGVEPE